MVRRLTKRSNPGLGHQVAALEDAAEIIQSDPEGFGGLESDLMNAHKTHKQHEYEMMQQKNKIRQFLVKKKYFRDDPLPNLLTYAEKEQIRTLHTRDPEEWSVERLAESFPATEEIIRKILKANWKPMSVKRIRSHDEGAFENWKLFKKGEFNEKLKTEFQEHLKKFADRRIEDFKTLPDPAKTLSKVQWQRPKCTEFSSLIAMQTKPKETNGQKALTDPSLKQQDNAQLQRINGEDETYIMSKVQSRQQMRIKELKESHLVSNAMASSSSTSDESNLSLEQKAILKLKNTSGTGIVKSEPVISSALDYAEKFESNEIVISEADKKRYEMTAIKE